MASAICRWLVLAMVLSPSIAISHPQGEDGKPQSEDGKPIETCDSPSCRRERERLEREKPTKSSFLDRLHLDVFGAPPEIGGESPLIGLVGAHITIAEIGRIHLYGPPGVMVALRSADEYADRWRPVTALTWGISIRVTEFRVRGSDRKTALFLNLTKLWTWGDFSSGTDFAGISFAWKRNAPQPAPAERGSRSTNRTSSATDPTASFDMTRPR